MAGAADETAVLIRAHSRIEDLRVCVDAIRRNWTGGAYRIIVASNGASAGYGVPDDIRGKIDRLIEVDGNEGHIRGSSRLLREGVEALPAECAFAVLMEADTWVFTDRVLRRYQEIMRRDSILWAGSEWIEKYWSLGLDCVIAQTSFLKGNADIFAFAKHAECAVCNRLIERSARFMYMREAMPVHVPKILKTFRKHFGGRFRSFPAAHMVTHHIEDLTGGMAAKRLLANICLGRREFDAGDPEDIRRAHQRLCAMMMLSRWLPRSRWFRRKKAMAV